MMVQAMVQPKLLAAASIRGRFRGNELGGPPIVNTSRVGCSFGRRDSTSACPVPPVAQGCPCTQSCPQRSTDPSTRCLRRVRQKERFALAPIAPSILSLKSNSESKSDDYADGYWGACGLLLWQSPCPTDCGPSRESPPATRHHGVKSLDARSARQNRNDRAAVCEDLRRSFL